MIGLMLLSMVGPPPPITDHLPAVYESKSSFGKAVAWHCVPKALDLGVTELGIALHEGREANPLLKNRGARIGIMTGVCALASVADYQAQKAGNKGLVKFLRGLSVAAGVVGVGSAVKGIVD